uniref:G-protein coupled receptors family 1 profile domain-containing protein n=1 Tax=Arion vulgaris TaxID=1028688 RepID=A0A0B7BJ48_9EUPU
MLYDFQLKIQDFNPRMKLTPRAVTIGTIGLLAFPWIASLVIVPIILQEFHFRETGIRENCFIQTQDSLQIFKSVDTATPILLAIIFLVVAAVLRYRGLHWGHSSGSMQIELISQGPEIDNIFAYVTAVVVSILCDLLLLITTFNNDLFLNYGISAWLTVKTTSFIMSDMRIILMLLPWLLLTDVRQRIRTWRPWYRPADGIDLTVTYSKEDN